MVSFKGKLSVHYVSQFMCYVNTLVHFTLDIFVFVIILA